MKSGAVDEFRILGIDLKGFLLILKKRIACNVIDVTINGKKQLCAEGLTLVELLDSLGMTSRAIAVEINQEIQPRDTHSQVEVKDGDILEIVTLVGGG